MKQFLKVSVFASMALLSILPSAANLGLPPDTRVSVGGRHIGYAQPNQISMESELVKLRITKQKCFVDATFNFKAGQAQEIKTGFPCNSATELHKFHAIVDGKKITSRLQAQTAAGTSDYRYWHTFDLSFKSQQVHAVKVTYYNILKGATQKMPIAVSRVLEEQEQDATADAEEKALALSREVVYVVETGADWKGPIGRCQIEVSFDGISPECVVSVSPKDWKKVGNKIVWDLKNFSPQKTDNIRIVLDTRRFAINSN